MIEVPTTELKKNVDYWLTYDYWGIGGSLGGTKVRFIKFLVSPKDSMGNAVVKDDSGQEYQVHKKAWLFGQDPTFLSLNRY